MKKALSAVLAAAFTLISFSGAAHSAEENVLTIYSAKDYKADAEMQQQFEKATGTKVVVVSGKAGDLLKKIKEEGQNCPADLFISVDGGILGNAKKDGLFTPATSKTIESNVPATLRDKDKQWTGVSTRARVIVYALDRVKPEQLSTYEDLASEKWRGKVLVRPASNLYNQSLVASLIAIDGEKKTAQWAKGLVGNFAREAKGNDRDQAKDIAAGKGDVGLMNTYYLGQMLASDNAEDIAGAKSVGVFFPNQKTTGTHINIAGIAVLKHAKNKAAAIRYIETITGKEVQEQISALNYEYPVNPAAKKAALLEQFGAFKPQEIDFSLLGTNNAKAKELMKEAGWQYN